MVCFLRESDVIKVRAVALILGVGLMSSSAAAEEFSFTFEWGDIPSCNTGRPNRVDNPIFQLSNVPDGTVELSFKMRDNDAPNYSHGGGTADYTSDTIEPGAFRYKSPCPPRETHTYRWTARALDANGDELAEATAERDYPE